MSNEQNCRQAFDDFYHKIKAEVSYDHWCAIWRFISKRQAKGEPVAYRWRKPIADNNGKTIWYTDWIYSGQKEFLAWWPHESLFTAPQLPQQQVRGEPVGWEYLYSGDWIRTTEPDVHVEKGRKVRALYADHSGEGDGS